MSFVQSIICLPLVIGILACEQTGACLEYTGVPVFFSNDVDLDYVTDACAFKIETKRFRYVCGLGQDANKVDVYHMIQERKND